jgi:hypothetical protein
VRIRGREAAYAHPLRQGRCEGTRAGVGAGEDSGVSFSLDTFSWTSKRKCPWVGGGAPRIKTNAAEGATGASLHRAPRLDPIAEGGSRIVVWREAPPVPDGRSAHLGNCSCVALPPAIHGGRSAHAACADRIEARGARQGCRVCGFVRPCTSQWRSHLQVAVCDRRRRFKQSYDVGGGAPRIKSRTEVCGARSAPHLL